EHCDKAIELYEKLLTYNLPAANKTAVEGKLDECRVVVAQQKPKIELVPAEPKTPPVESRPVEPGVAPTPEPPPPPTEPPHRPAAAARVAAAHRRALAAALVQGSGHARARRNGDRRDRRRGRALDLGEVARQRLQEREDISGHAITRRQGEVARQHRPGRDGH